MASALQRASLLTFSSLNEVDERFLSNERATAHPHNWDCSVLDPAGQGWNADAQNARCLLAREDVLLGVLLGSRALFSVPLGSRNSIVNECSKLVRGHGLEHCGGGHETP